MQVTRESQVTDPENNNPSRVRAFCSSVVTLFYEQSIFFALNNKAIEGHLQKYKDLSWAYKIQLGIKNGLSQIVVRFCLRFFLILILSGMKDGISAKLPLPSMKMAVIAAVMEEVVYRGILQNIFAFLQKKAVPKCLKEYRVIKWIASPSARILAVNTIFAAIHLRNGGGYLNEKSALIQFISIMLLPSKGTIYETTNSFLAPVATHVTHNFVLSCIVKLLLRS